MVLYFHGYYNEAEPFPVAQAVQVIGSGNGLWCVANTLFFLLSGMLFFNGIESVKGCYPKMKKRVHSLLVPYLIWNVIFILWYDVLQNLPGIGGYINSDMVGSLTKNGLLDALRVLYWEPANFPLWFVRDLMIMVAVSPLLYYLIKYLKWFTPILLVAISPFVNIHVSPFFILGGCIAMHSSLEKVHKITNGGHILVIYFYLCGQCHRSSVYRLSSSLPYVCGMSMWYNHCFETLRLDCFKPISNL